MFFVNECLREVPLKTEAYESASVFLIEDNECMREILSDFLASESFCVQSWPDAHSFLEERTEVELAVIVTDIKMSGMSGIDLHARLLELNYEAPIIYITGNSTLSQVVEAMKIGAYDIFIKPFDFKDLLAAISSAIEHRRFELQRSVEKLRVEGIVLSLSRREGQVLDLLLRGYGNAEILKELDISLPTAKQYKAQVFRKLGVRNLSQLMAKMRSINSELY